MHVHLFPTVRSFVHVRCDTLRSDSIEPAFKELMYLQVQVQVEAARG